MEHGVVVEEGPSKEFFSHPKEERVREFLASVDKQENTMHEEKLS
jgi:cystine transport system ATP-binding protein/L-cystine transport system ATP-binding protein